MSKIRPSPNRAEPPHFEDLDDGTFEEFCCALLEREPEIVRTDLYKTKGQKQFGVDVIGELQNDDGLHVISCKVRSVLKKGDIPNFSNEFLDYWETHWKSKKVKKFILAVTYRVNSDQREKDIQAEKKRFKKLGIDYEPWPPRKLQGKVRPHRQIAFQYLGDQVAEQICGRDQPAIAPIADGQSFIDASISQQIVDMQKALSGKIEQQLQQAREQIRKKEGHKVDEILSGIENDKAQWSSLSAKTKAAVKRLMASRAVHKNDLKLAKELCVEAESYDQSKTGTLKAIIVLIEDGQKAALKLLATATTPDELKLRAGLRISTLNSKYALADLKALPKKEKDGEALRLYSLAYLVKGDRAKALSCILKAEQDYGDWYAVQRTAVAVRFHMSHSPCVPFYLSAWPNPIIPELVMENDEAQKYLKEGLSNLEILLEKVKNDPEGQKDLQVWRVAYLSNIKSRSLEAESYVKELLEKDRTFAGVIIWALARGYNFNVVKSRDALEKLASARKAEIEQILCLVGLYHTQNNHSDAKRLLEDMKYKFNTPELTESWNHWYLKNDVENIKLQEDHASIYVQLAYHIDLAAKDNHWGKLSTFLETADKNKLEPGHFFVACLNFARHAQWKLIGPYISLLIEKIQTPDAIRIAAISAYNTGNSQDALNILDQNLHVFPQNKLPVDMRRLRKKAAMQEGDFSYALSEGEKLITETNTIEDRLEHINALFSIGDLRGATHHIKGILSQGDLSSTLALQLSATIQGTDPSLASQLFKKVQPAELPDEFVGPFLGQANKLGIDDDLQDLFGRIDSLAEQKPQLIRMMSIDDIKEFMHGKMKESERVGRMYAQGAIPVHFFSSFQGISLAQLVLGNFSDASERVMPQKSKLLFRFAGRKPNLDIHLENINLHLDITSALIAYRLGLLDLIEENVGSISIPPHLPAALIHIENDLKHPQPERLEAMKEMLSALEKGNIKSIPRRADNTFDLSADIQGVVIVHHNKELAKEDIEDGSGAVNIRQVINGLQKAGHIDKEKIEQLNKVLPGYMKAPAFGMILNKGDKLIFDYNTLELLVSEKLLKACTQTFDIYLDQTYIDHAKDDIAVNEFKDSIAKEVSELREFLTDKIKAHRYKVFSQSDMDNPDSHPDGIQNETEACLLDLVRLKEKEGTVVWVDDRHVNRHLNVNNNPIVDTYDILNLLLARRIIDGDQFHKFLLLLRKANYYYIPVTTDEIIHHLQKSTAQISQDTETEALRTIRQYVSMILLQEDFLSFNLQDQNAFDEKRLLYSTFMLADKSILSVWCDSSIPLETKKTYSAWIWESLRVERVTRLPLLQASEEGYEYLYVVSLAGLLVNAMQIPSDLKAAREDYLEWLDIHILRKALATNKGLARKIAKHVGELFLSLFDNKDQDFSSEDQKQQIRMYLSELVTKFPDAIKEEILKTKNVSNLINLKRISLITVQNKQCIAQDFWRGVGEALKNGSASIKTQNKKDSLDIYLLSEDGAVPVFKIGKNGEQTLSDPLFSFLHPKKSAVLKAIKDNKQWFEYPNDKRQKIEKTILNAKDLPRRARIIYTERSNAPAYKYTQLESRVANTSSFEWTELMPVPVERLLNHLRLKQSKSDDITVRITKAAATLISEEGPEVAFQLFSGLPIYIPESIIEAFQAMPPKALNVALKNIFNLCHSPLRLFHFLYLVRSIKKNPRKIDQANQAIERLQKDGLKLCEAYTSVLYYFNKIFCADPEWLELTTEERVLVCWYHSDQIANLLLRYRMPFEHFAEQFKTRHVPVSNHFLLRYKNYRTCPYAPSNIHAKSLFFAGLKASIGNNCKKLLSDSEIQAFNEYFIIRENDKSLTDPWILRNNSEYRPSLRSFLADNKYEFALSLGGDVFAKWLKAENMSDLVKELRDNIKANPNEAKNWLDLCVCYDAALLPETALDILELAPKIDFYSLFKQGDELAATILQYVTDAINLFDDSELTELYKQTLLAVIKRLAQDCKRSFYLSGGSEKDWVTHPALSLSNALIILAKRNSLKETLGILASTILELCIIYPSLAPIWRKALNSLIDDLDFTTAGLLWDTQIKLRTME